MDGKLPENIRAVSFKAINTPEEDKWKPLPHCCQNSQMVMTMKSTRVEFDPKETSPTLFGKGTIPPSPKILRVIPQNVHEEYGFFENSDCNCRAFSQH